MKPYHNRHSIMDPGRYGSARTVDAVDPVSYDTWPTLASAHQQQRSYCSPCSRRRLTWTAVSVLELILMILTAVYCFFLPEKYLAQIVEKENRGKINELSEWVLRMYGSMICVQVRCLENEKALLSYVILLNKQSIRWVFLTLQFVLTQAFVFQFTTNFKSVKLSLGPHSCRMLMYLCCLASRSADFHSIHFTAYVQSLQISFYFKSSFFFCPCL